MEGECLHPFLPGCLDFCPMAVSWKLSLSTASMIPDPSGM